MNNAKRFGYGLLTVVLCLGMAWGAGAQEMQDAVPASFAQDAVPALPEMLCAETTDGQITCKLSGLNAWGVDATEFGSRKYIDALGWVQQETADSDSITMVWDEGEAYLPLMGTGDVKYVYVEFDPQEQLLAVTMQDVRGRGYRLRRISDGRYGYSTVLSDGREVETVYKDGQLLSYSVYEEGDGQYALSVFTMEEDVAALTYLNVWNDGSMNLRWQAETGWEAWSFTASGYAPCDEPEGVELDAFEPLPVIW